MAFSGEKYLKLWLDEAKALDEERQEAASSPVKYPAPQKEKNGWFQSGEFRDGYQFGDVAKTLLGTSADIVEDLQKGVIGIGERVVDTGAYLAGSVGGLFGADDFKKDMKDFIAKDLWDEEKIVKSGNVMDPLLQMVGSSVEESSLLGKKSDALVASGGQLLGTAALQRIGVPWYITTGITSFGGEVDNALGQGANFTQAGGSAAITAAAEMLSEKLFGGSGLGEKGLIKLDKLTNGISNKLVKALVDYGLDMASEGSEEVVSQLASNLGSKLYREENLKEILFSEEAIDSYIDSFVAGSIMGGFSNASKFVNSAKSAVSDLRAPNKGNATPAPTTAENSPSGDSTPAQTPLDVDDLIDEAIARALNAPSDPVGAAVEGFKATGTITNNQARDILNSVRAVSQLIEQTGIKLPDTAAGRRTAVKEAVAQLAQRTQTGSQPDAEAQNTPDAEAPESQVQAYVDALLDEIMPIKSAQQPVETNMGPATPHASGGSKVSRLYSNTYANATGEAVRDIGQRVQELDANIARYDPVTEEESFSEAVGRTNSPEARASEIEKLLNKDGWDGSDNDTAYLILDKLRQEGDTVNFAALAAKQRSQNTTAGQLIQSNVKYSRENLTKRTVDAFNTLADMTEKDVSRKYWKEQGFEAWKQEMGETILDISNQLEQAAESGSVEDVRRVIRSLARFRRTTAWFGLSDNLAKVAEKALNNIDADTAKAMAMAQLSQIPEDFRKRPVGQVVETIRVHNMLAALTTVGRNLVGNATCGLMDALSDSTVARGLDILASKITGKRTVGNDLVQGKAYLEAGCKAAEIAALCVELDIPMDTESRFTEGFTRTFSPQGGPVTRLLGAYEKVMRYNLEVTDQFFSGGTAGAVEQSLLKLGKQSNLSEEEIADLSRQIGLRRTFKEDRMLANAATGVKKGLNQIGKGHLGLGNAAMTFARTGSNVAQTGADYTGAGIVIGLKELIQLRHDVKTGLYGKDGVKTDSKTGKKTTLAMAQRRAVSNMGRGLTGIGLTTLFTAAAIFGVLKVHDDEDRDAKALDQSDNLSGAQLNLSALLRSLTGESTDWQPDDWVISMDFLEPFNSQMYLGYALSKEDGIGDALKAYPGLTVKSLWQSMLDMPLMQGLSDVVNIAKSKDPTDAAGQLIGNQATSFIPSWVRQTAYMTDPYYRDTTGDSAMEKAVNQLKSNIPGLSQTLPKKYSGFGEEQLRHEGGVSGFFNTYINPGKIGRISTNDIVDSLDRISEASGKKAIYPDYIAPSSFTYTDEDGAKQTVTISGKKMTETYQKTYGENVAGLYSDLLSMDYFNSLDAQTQASIMESAKSYATKLARASVSDYSEIPEYIKKKPADMSEAEAIVRQNLVGTTTMYTDISISSAVYVHDLLDSLKDLPRETKADGTPYANVREIQKLEAVVSDDSLSKYVDDLLRDILQAGPEAKYDKALDAGYTPAQFVEGYRQYLDIEGKNKKQSIIRYCQQEMGMSYAAAKKLCDIYYSKTTEE